MIRHTITLRPRYSETDQMGVVYYSRYAEYFEVARTEWLRALGMSYAWMEKQLGVLLPVRSLSIQYKGPAYYDELLTIQTCVKEKPTRTIRFFHEIWNPSEKCIVTGEVELVFVDARTWKPIKAPDAFLTLIDHFWNNG